MSSEGAVAPDGPAGPAGPTHSAGAHNARHDSVFGMGTNMSEKPTIIDDLADDDPTERAASGKAEFQWFHRDVPTWVRSKITETFNRQVEHDGPAGGGRGTCRVCNVVPVSPRVRTRLTHMGFDNPGKCHCRVDFGWTTSDAPADRHGSPWFITILPHEEFRQHREAYQNREKRNGKAAGSGRRSAGQCEYRRARRRPPSENE